MNLSARLIQLYRHLLTSYWCIPVAILFLAMLLAALTTGLDHVFAGRIQPENFYLQPLEPETARVVLSMIAGSILGVAGVVFSITMVAVSFASGTFGPRLIGNMMRDRGSQVSLGCFIGTFVYALIVLRFVRIGGEDVAAFTPYISIGMAMALAIFCMGVMIYYIHHVPETINIELIIAKLGRTLKTGIENRFDGTGAERGLLRAEIHQWIDNVYSSDATKILSAADGYIQALDLDKLDEIARAQDLKIEILRRPGAFVTTSYPVLAVWGQSELTDDVRRRLQGCYALGASPTVNQNIEFVADQLVEIIARALSPGVNDPFTAIACVNWLQVGILHFARHESLNDTFNRTERVYSKPYLFRDFVTDIFDKVLPYITPNRQVTIYTRNGLAEMSACLPLGGNRDVIEEILKVLREHHQDSASREQE
jgi:uncharacterized membrane protein